MQKCSTCRSRTCDLQPTAGVFDRSTNAPPFVFSLRHPEPDLQQTGFYETVKKLAYRIFRPFRRGVGLQRISQFCKRALVRGLKVLDDQVEKRRPTDSLKCFGSIDDGYEMKRVVVGEDRRV